MNPQKPTEIILSMPVFQELL